ncbi:MAG TPA: excinuclease ATPase subunit [Candidatus Binatia bacterium]|nr:excinuclease ATPase subunit [Candidatus Binatia bacterium]HXV84615.1 excinuclease ATPase subunit [Candidatus Binatia bacterium]
MKHFTVSMAVLVALLVVIGPASARDTKHILPIAAAMAIKDAEEKLDGSVKFFFGKQEYPKVLTKLGTDVSNRKTNAFGKSDENACNWAFLSAMIALEKRAKELGANAVVNIVSYYRKVEMSSTTDFECHAGAIIAGVALKGDFVKIAEE